MSKITKYTLKLIQTEEEEELDSTSNKILSKRVVLKDLKFCYPDNNFIAAQYAREEAINSLFNSKDEFIAELNNAEDILNAK